jgi:hypothetical protein
MDKTWLIRTKNNHILGPVTKNKVKELIEKGSIKGEDEVCNGNGYWFYIREKELINKYIIGDVPQGFNPVSEADTVLCKGGSSPQDSTNPAMKPVAEPTAQEGNTTLPTDDDLAYPDMETVTPDESDLEYPDLDEVTEKKTENLDPVKIPELKEQLDDVDLEPIASEDEVYVSEEDDSADEETGHKINRKYKKKPVKLTQRRVKKKEGNVSVKTRNDNYLFVVAFLLLAIAIGVFVFRKTLMKKLMHINYSKLIMNKAYAQVTTPVVNMSKKKL